jgi:hypothetical protein
VSNGQGYFSSWFRWSKCPVAALKADIWVAQSCIELHKVAQSCTGFRQKNPYVRSRFLVDTLQPMLNIQGLRLILPQAPEELSSSVLFEPCFPFDVITISIPPWWLPFYSAPFAWVGTFFCEETLQNQKLQSWFLPINGQWIIDDRVLAPALGRVAPQLCTFFCMHWLETMYDALIGRSGLNHGVVEEMFVVVVGPAGHPF